LASPSPNDRGLSVHTVVVCFNPDVGRVEAFCRRLATCGYQVVLVDNSEPGGSLEVLAGSGCAVLTLGRNTGIAHAQNTGIRRAIAGGADAVVLFDQDSKIEEGCLASLTAGLRSGEPRVVAPVVVDEATGSEIPSHRLTSIGLPTDVFARGRCDPCPVDVVIASGTAATKEVFDLAGPMDESLFIDYVDTE
jgi:rhamnosyltransferase